MRQKVIDVYSIEELSENAKEKAFHHWLEFTDYAWSIDNTKALRAFEDIFPIDVTNWEYDQWNYHISFDFTDYEVEDLEGFRLAKYIYNNYYDDLFKGKFYSKDKWENGKFTYKSRHSNIIMDNTAVLTGYYIDDFILEPIYEFLKNPDEYTTFKGLMKECLDSWGKACVDDFEACTSMEYFIEESKANEWEYDEFGNRI